MKSLKLKKYPGENVIYCCAEILVYAERLESSGAFNPDHLGYIISIFEDTSDSKLPLWDIQKYKEFIEFIKKLCGCNIDVIPKEELIPYESLVQYSTREYKDIVDSKRWEPASSK